MAQNPIPLWMLWVVQVSKHWRDNFSNTLSVDSYAARIQEYIKQPSRTSDFHVGLDGYAWIFSMALWTDFVLPLLALKPHK